jgi:hypothetical protein
MRLGIIDDVVPSIGLMVTVGSVSATVTAWLASVD